MYFFLALAAAILWGVSYTLSEQLYRHISPLTLLAIEFTTAAVIFLYLAIDRNDLGRDLRNLAHTGKGIAILVVCIATLVIAELCINFSIKDKDATLASLVEISYPLFVVIFSWLFLREDNLTLPTLLGGLLVVAGVTVIYVFG